MKDRETPFVVVISAIFFYIIFEVMLCFFRIASMGNRIALSNHTNHIVLFSRYLYFDWTVFTSVFLFWKKKKKFSKTPVEKK